MISKKLLTSYVQSMGVSSLSTSSLLKCSDILKQSRKFSALDVLDYSKLSYDSNPLHFDSEFAKNAGFEDKLVPGLLVALFFPRIIASHFPGAVYVSQTLHFKSPVYVEEEVSSELKAISIRQMKSKYIAKFSTKCFKNGGLLAVDGEVTAILPTLSVAQV